ncbi:phosphatase PAP2 family protein [Bacillus benzoevorans]|uniref:Undecaprenyl-diphosphatase n=1 Tax=Bacillus benzoevorans TaxID=1456 RepID=A0A7X0HP14_9BACI|nr:phosphatase PAP2 family protein [Bacillus benzoevorans]MBB6444289.1 undecaprenyl-diphosphatase [Bacillus benzoevorans]
MKIQSPTYILLSILSLAGFSFMAYTISVHEVLIFDRRIISIVQGWENPILTYIMKFFTTIGSSNVTIVLSLIILFFLFKVLHHRSELFVFTIVIIGSSILNGLLKQIFHRARPELHRIIDIGGYSFPSGHAMNAFTFYGILTFLLWRHITVKQGRIILIWSSSIMIFMIGLSRVYLGVHYPSDIIGGYLGSGCWLALSIWTFQLYKEKQSRRQMVWNE